MKIAVLAACLCIAAPAFAKTQPIQTAKVISQQIDTDQVDRGVVTGTPIVRYRNIVVIETAAERMTLAEVSNYVFGTSTQDVRNAVPLPINGSVEFYREKNYLVIFDSDHRKHKFVITHLEAASGN